LSIEQETVVFIYKTRRQLQHFIVIPPLKYGFNS